ncbi:MAG: TIGR04063 family PEP-CTERM/XrtA system glycosyltransferase [Duganella sp.]
MSWRILHILDHSLPLHSGYAFRTIAILRQQRRLGWHTAQLTSARHAAGAPARESEDSLRTDTAGGEQVAGWQFFRTRPLHSWWTRLPVLRQLAVVVGLARRLRQVALHERPDILHAHSPSLNALAALHVGRALGIPVLYEIRALWEDAAADQGSSPAGGLRYRLTRALDDYVLRRVQAVTTICEGLRTELVARGVAPERITVIPNAVDLEQFRPASAGAGLLAHQLGLTGRLVIGFIGSFYPYEGLILLIRALPQMLAAIPSLHLLLVGGGPQDTTLRQLTNDLGLAGRITFTGPIEHEKIGAYYGLLEVLVYPRLSLRVTELVTPLKPLEAMAQGKLIVASDVGGHREMIEHGKTGMLFRAGDANALASEVVRLLGQRSSWPALRLHARAYAERERSWTGSIARYREVYQQLAPKQQAHKVTRQVSP